jgi:hypothetical protein
MAVEQFSLNPLGPIILEMRDRLVRMRNGWIGSSGGWTIIRTS